MQVAQGADILPAAAAMTHLAASVCVAACVTLFAAAVLPAVLAAPAPPADIYGCIRAEVSMAVDGVCTTRLNAHDTAARDGQAVHYCMAPGGFMALSQSLHQQSALGYVEGLQASQQGWTTRRRTTTTAKPFVQVWLWLWLVSRWSNPAG